MWIFFLLSYKEKHHLISKHQDFGGEEVRLGKEKVSNMIETLNVISFTPVIISIFNKEKIKP